MKPLPELYELIAPMTSYSQRDIHRAAFEMGVPTGTLYRIIMGYSENCQYKTARKISLYLSARSRDETTPTEE